MGELDDYPNTAHILEKYEAYFIYCLKNEHSQGIIDEIKTSGSG